MAKKDYRDLCIELVDQLDDLLARSIQGSTYRTAKRTFLQRVLFWRDITPSEAAQELAYDTQCFELIRKARIAIDEPECADAVTEIIDYYNALAVQHPGQCVFHAPADQKEMTSTDD